MVFRLALCLSLVAAPAFAEGPADFTLIQMNENSAQIESGGVPYICGLTRTETAIALTDCLPVMSEPQANRLQEAVDEAARLAEAASEAKERLAEAEAAKGEAEAKVAGLEAAAASVPALEARIAELEALLEPYLAADAEGRATLALLEKAKSVKTAGGDLGRLTNTDLIEFTKNGLSNFFEPYGNRCGINVEEMQGPGKEEELQQTVLTTIFTDMQMSEEIKALMLSFAFELMNDEGSLHAEYVEAINNSSDNEVYTLGREARMIARDNIKALNNRIEETVTRNPDHVAISNDRTTVTIVGCE